jgi:hypothetical protein
MGLDYSDFVHPNHFMIFVAAAQTFNCHILVRQTGRATLSWVGKRGYTGKRADMKAKTANLNVGRHSVAGLVCSPLLRPEVFTPDRLVSALKEWQKSSHLITVPRDKTGFDDNTQPRGCLTPYIVQTNPNHKHYGCVALVDMGLLIPRYVHGDYDLYAIISAKQAFDPSNIPIRRSTLGSTMAPDRLGLQERLRMEVPNLEGPLSFQVANYINTRIAGTSPDLLGALMVNHGEQVNIGSEGNTFEPVLAIMPKQVNSQWARILATRRDHEQFYRESWLS